MNTDKRSGICQQCSFKILWVQSADGRSANFCNCIHAKDKFRAIYIVKVHESAPVWLQVVDEVVTKMRFQLEDEKMSRVLN